MAHEMSPRPRSVRLWLGVLAALLACLLAPGERSAEAAPAPAITSISPAIGPSAGGTAITITGTGFAAGAAVNIGGAAATAVIVVSGTQITATTPAGAPGAAVVTITNADTQSATLNGGFSFQFPAPTVASILPVSGTSAGGTAITITGTGFRAGATASIGGAAATAVVVVNATTITATTPAHLVGAASVAVTNSDAQSATLTNGYTYNAAPAPTVTAVAPGSGSVGGGTAVTVTGAGFVTGAAVAFGSAAASAVVVVNATTITATTPPGAAPGAVAVTVTSPDTQSGVLNAAYTYNPLAAPTVTSVTPASGPAAGGTAITIAGTGFVAGATATIGGVAVGSVVVANATSITGTSPQRSPSAAATVVVTNPDGQSGMLLNGFTATANASPVASTVTPATGPTTGGTAITITGTGFLPGATVLIGGTAATQVTVIGTTLITAVTPAQAAGQLPVTVLNYDGRTGTNTTGFTYKTGATPTLASLTPTSGPPAGGTTVTLTGTNFQAGATVRFGAGWATGVTVLGSTGILAVTPAGLAGAVPVVLTNPDGQVAALAAGFTYGPTPAPVVTAVTPGSGSFLGGTAVTISGTGFIAGATVTFGGFTATNVSVASPTAITATTPLNVAGAVPVIVTNPDGQAGMLTAAFTYGGAAPTITAIDPGSGTLAGGTAVTITGSGFVAGATVTFGGAAATNVTVASGEQLTATTPAATATGAVDVAVANPGTAAATLASGFTYLAAGTANVATTPPVGGMVFMVSGTNDLQALIAAQKFKVVAVFALDVPTQTWKIHLVGAPLNSLTAIKATDIVVLRR